MVVRVLERSSSLRNFASRSGGRKRVASYRGVKGRHRRRRSSVDIAKKGWLWWSSLCDERMGERLVNVKFNK